MLLLAALREVPLRVLVIHLHVGDLVVVYHLRLVLDLGLWMTGPGATAMHLLLLLHLLISLSEHLVDKLSGLGLVLGVTRILTRDTHRRYVLSLARGRRLLRQIVLLLLHHLLLLLLLRLIHHIWFLSLPVELSAEVGNIWNMCVSE